MSVRQFEKEMYSLHSVFALQLELCIKDSLFTLLYLGVAVVHTVYSEPTQLGRRPLFDEH